MNVKEPIIFAAGAAIGSVITYFAVKGKYAKIAQEEIDSVYETFSKIDQENRKKAEAAKNKPDISTIKVEPVMDTVNELEKYDALDPYMVTMDEFNELDGLEKVTILLYSDGVFADDINNEVDVDDFIGTKLHDYIESHDMDEMYVRNYKIGMDVEIVKDARTYEESLGT